MRLVIIERRQEQIEIGKTRKRGPLRLSFFAGKPGRALSRTLPGICCMVLNDYWQSKTPAVVWLPQSIT
jgi:hypothetical protein